jgi:hypothetical protein
MSTKLKLKLFHYTPRRRLGERRINSYSFSTSAIDGVSGQRHAPAALYPWGKESRYPLYRSWVGPRSGLDTEVGGKSTEHETRSLSSEGIIDIKGNLKQISMRILETKRNDATSEKR